MYNGVPLMDVSTMVFEDMARAKPKSHSLTLKLSVSSTLVLLMSRCTSGGLRRWCRYWPAMAVCRSIRRR